MSKRESVDQKFERLQKMAEDFAESQEVKSEKLSDRAKIFNALIEYFYKGRRRTELGEFMLRAMNEGEATIKWKD